MEIIYTLTSIGLFNDAVGSRMSVTYSEVNAETGQIISDNKRLDRVITDEVALEHVDAIRRYASNFIKANANKE